MECRAQCFPLGQGSTAQKGRLCCSISRPAGVESLILLPTPSQAHCFHRTRPRGPGICLGRVQKWSFLPRLGLGSSCEWCSFPACSVQPHPGWAVLSPMLHVQLLWGGHGLHAPASHGNYQVSQVGEGSGQTLYSPVESGVSGNGPWAAMLQSSVGRHLKTLNFLSPL